MQIFLHFRLVLDFLPHSFQTAVLLVFSKVWKLIPSFPNRWHSSCKIILHYSCIIKKFCQKYGHITNKSNFSISSDAKRHSRENGNPENVKKHWILSFAGMTIKKFKKLPQLADLRIWRPIAVTKRDLSIVSIGVGI